MGCAISACCKCTKCGTANATYRYVFPERPGVYEAAVTYVDPSGRRICIDYRCADDRRYTPSYMRVTYHPEGMVVH